MTSPETTQLRLSSGNGPITRTILSTPIRAALPHEIPIIDVSPVFSPSLDLRRTVASQIRQAATTNGFFYITNHGIAPATTAAAHAAALAFFRRPAAAKEPANQARSAYHRGWKPPATQRVNPFESVDVRETFSVRYDPQYDAAVADVSAIPRHIMDSIELDADDFPWSATPPQFKRDCTRALSEVITLARALLRSFALALELEETALDDKFTHPDVGMALNYYPSLPPSPPATPRATPQPKEDSETVSIGSHTDFQLFTLLSQDSVGGLQVLSRSGQWLHATPVPGTFVVNFGDYMQRITNDMFPSTVHRVQNRSGGERLSMAFFFGFNLNESCEVLESCVQAGEERRYEAISCKEWTRRRLHAMHDVKEAGEVGRLY
ncbi:hypothetical protein B0T17DRAFT_501030 [Bombardia bombarda]|uniref:Fe2OG dioxygenase domain-containing protein n=1 Tax=Bombardia bombarda TaxID=252184 RepID=A0AA39W3W9_9PEZI|nr:hypothetical protein B0T17DRAFT_501030 [Bombardia bombarda]